MSCAIRGEIGLEIGLLFGGKKQVALTVNLTGDRNGMLSVALESPASILWRGKGGLYRQLGGSNSSMCTGVY